MKSLYFFFAFLFVSIVGFAQTTDTVSLGASYTQQVYYSLETGVKTASVKNDWDLAFEMTNQGYSIWINAATGTEVYLHPGDTSDWSTIDTAGISGWTQRHNSDTSWSFGALSQDQSGFDVGWGTYNMITHNVVGDRIFVIKLSNGSYQKLWIKGLAGGIYTFRHASVFGSMDMVHTLDKANFSGKSFGYYSLEFHNHVDKEPLAADWDLFFGQYTTYVPTPYVVTGVLQGMGVKAVKAYPVNDASTYEDYGSHTFQDEINTLGYDWKPYNMSTMMYEIVDSTVYFVQTAPGDIWNLVFTHFGGSADGDMVFNKKRLLDVGVEEAIESKVAFSVYPNPANESVNIIYNMDVNSQLSIHDLSGRIVYTQNLTAGGIRELVDVSALEAGIYMVNVSTATDRKTQKLIIQ